MQDISTVLVNIGFSFRLYFEFRLYFCFHLYVHLYCGFRLHFGFGCKDDENEGFLIKINIQKEEFLAKNDQNHHIKRNHQKIHHINDTHKSHKSIDI